MKHNRSVERALSVLLFVCQSEKSLGLTEVSLATNLDKATTLRLLKTLASFDMVRYEAGTRKYMQGPGIYNFWPSEIRKICRPHLSKLMESVHETICLIVPKGAKRLCLDAIEPDRELRIVAPIGRELPIYVGASGRIFMAHKPLDQAKTILSSLDFTGRESSHEFDSSTYLAQLEGVRKKGYAHNVGEVATDTSTVAAPVFDGLGNTAAAVVVRGPTTRMSGQKISEMAGLIKMTAQSITNEMININT